MGEYLESTPRSFMIEGKMVDGKYVAVKDNTCIGPCVGVTEFEWKCDPKYVPGSEYPPTPPNEVEVAVFKWVMELGHAITLDGAACSAALSEHYHATNGMLQLWGGGQPAGPPMNATTGAATLCGALGSTADPSLGAMEIEACGTSVRGYFGPFTDASGFPFEAAFGKEYLESTPRSFMIEGKMVDGKYVAVKDNTFIGPCVGVTEFEWKCDPKYVPGSEYPPTPPNDVESES